MSKQIWLAPVLNHNRQQLIDRCAEMLAAGPPYGFLYLTASRPLLELVTRGLLDGKRNRGVWGTLPVFLFRGLVRHLLATAVDADTGLPLAPRIPIDRDELPLRRSLLAQVMSRLVGEGKLKALATMAHREGCVSSIATLLGEIARAAKSPEEFASIVETRWHDYRLTEEPAQPSNIPRQIDFDRDIALIYCEYRAALDRFHLTDDDTDQLRALGVLRGELDGRSVSAPLLSQVKLLVLDGFFDFAPAQGEMLRLLIRSVPAVIVNLNRDESNEEIFRPLSATIEQLESIAGFKTIIDVEALPVTAALSPLRQRLFNPSPLNEPSPPKIEEEPEPCITLLECSDRQTEIRAIAKHIKRVILNDGYSLAEIALVVRELASYVDVIARVLEEEGIPCSAQARIQLTDVPSVRAALKLFDLLGELGRENATVVKLTDLADLVKSGYFRLPEADLDLLRERFEQDYAHLLNCDSGRRWEAPAIGRWDADEFENVVAFVGSQLRVDKWLKRARLLTARTGGGKLLEKEREEDPDGDEPTTESLGEDATVLKLAVSAEPVEVPLPGSERRPRPREVHPALIAWSALIIERLAELILATPRAGSPRELRAAAMRLLDQLQFGAQVTRAGNTTDAELPRLTLDLRGLEGIRRSFAAAARAVEMAGNETPARIRLTTLLDEAARCARAQSLVTSTGAADGLKVLEATDVRGLRFRAVFIAGLVEGGFPLRTSRDWIYSREERERLKQYGLTLEDISPDTLLKEEHYFYQAACRATEQLYLSRPLVLEDGAETVASYYIAEVERAVAPLRITQRVVRNDFDGRMLFESSTQSELARSLVRQEERHRHRAQREGSFDEDLIRRVKSFAYERGYLSASALNRIRIERERESARFGSFDGVLVDPNLIARLREAYGSRHSFSASELSLYGKCPFKFFAERVLKLEPRGEAALDLSALDAGSLLHEVLRRFFERHRRQRLTDLDRAELRRELSETADAVFDEHERAVPPLNPQVWRIDREIRKLMLEQVLDYELSIQARAESQGVLPAYFEVAFGMEGEGVDSISVTQPLLLHRGSLDEPDTVRVRGQIDRVDLARDKTAIAYDYKLSRGASLDDMEEGRALQLHIYLAALERLLLPESRIAGGGYYTIKGGQARRNQGLYRAALQAYTGVGTRTSSTLSDEKWTEIRSEMESRIWEFIDGIRAGGFQVEPSAPDATCPHCDYSAVCRYEKFRIKRKENDDPELDSHSVKMK